MKPKLNLKPAAGVQARQIDRAFCFYKGARPYRHIKLDKKITILPPAEPPGFRHPWKTSVRWYDKGEGLKNNKGEDIEGFGASVNPGLVSGIDPVALGAWAGTTSSQPAAPKVSLGSGVTLSKNKQATQSASKPEPPGLLDFPLIPLPARSFTLVENPMPEGYPKISIPLGLRALGVVEHQGDFSVSGSFSGGSMQFSQNTAQDPNSVKYCAMTWFYLRTARPMVMPKGDVDMSNAFLDGVKYRTKYSMENLSKWGLRSQFMTGLPPQNPVPPPPGPFKGPPTDLGFDFFPIVEIFLVTAQPPRRDGQGKPIVDGGWIPFVRHHCFWNLEHRFDASFMGEEDKLQTGNAALFALPLIGAYTIAPIATGAALASMQNEAVASNINMIKGSYWT